MTLIKDNQARKIIGNIFSLGLLQIVNYILPILTIPFLVSTIGIGNVGVIAIATALCTYFQICIDYGFSLTATRAIAKERDDLSIASKITSAVINIKICMALVMSCFFIVLILSVDRYRDNIMIFIATFAICFFQSIFPQWHFQAVEKMKYITIANSIPKIVATILLFVFISDPDDTLKVQLIYICGAVFATAWAMLILYFKLGFRYSIDLNMIKTQISNGWSIFLARLFSTLYKNSNILIISILYPAGVVGVYAVTEKIIRAAQNLQNVVGDSLFPWVAKESKGTEGFFKKLNGKFKYIIFIAYAACSLFAFIFANIIAKILVGDEWVAVGEQLRIMSLVFLFGGLNYFYGILGLVAHGFNKYFSIAVMGAGIFNVTACYALTSAFSISGASATMALSEVVLLLLIAFFIKKAGIVK